MGPAVKTFLILGKKEEGFMPARSLLRPGEEERKTEAEIKGPVPTWEGPSRAWCSPVRSLRKSCSST